MKKLIIYIGLICLLSSNAIKAQQPTAEGKVDYPVFLDKGDDLGKVMIFQSKDNPNDYYYLPNQVRVKTNAQGVLEMGFQQFVKNEKSGADAEETRTKGSGGGYFWMTVGFGLTPEDRQDAERELQRRKPGSRLIGAMAYESGTAELESFGVKDKTDSKTELLGVANAPLMEGDAVAVSMVLDAENATKLWESFKLPVPYIQMNFNMNFRGYHSPISAKITMDMEKIYNHKKMSVGIQTPFLGAEIEEISKDLENSGAIKFEKTGDFDIKEEEKFKEVLENFRSECFSPMNNMMDMMYSQNSDGESPLDRAETLRQRRNGNTANQGLPLSASVPQPSTTVLPQNTTIPPPNTTITQQSPAIAQPNTPETQQTGAEPLLPGASDGGTPEPPPPAIGAATAPAGTPAPQASAPNPQTSTPNPQTPQNNNNTAANNLGISIYAGFQMKNIRTRGKKTFELNKIRTANRNRAITLTMPRIPKANLQQITLDDPLYKQRELMTMIDGFSSRDFGQYINFVNVTMRKKHPKGDVSTDEVVINRTNFNKEGNRFKLLYGWKPGDNDRRTWMDYDYKTVWSFFGGGEITDDWQSSQKGVINVAPPCRKEVIKLEGDPEDLKQKEVRAINVKISYTVAGVKRSVLKSFNLSKAEPLVAEVEIIQPNNVFEYEYEIIWQLKGNRTVTTGVKRGDTTTLFLDELPQ
jgi:hypothetical protein